jgi:hypothetical protein
LSAPSFAAFPNVSLLNTLKNARCSCVSRDGARMVVSQEAEQVSGEITIVTGWRGLLK